MRYSINAMPHAGSVRRDMATSRGMRKRQGMALAVTIMVLVIIGAASSSAQPSSAAASSRVFPSR